MLEFYPHIKFVHIACVLLSGSLFAVRGLLALANSALVDHAALRLASYTIDSTLLTAALMLATILHQYPFVQGWLTAKILLLVAYIVLGGFALRRARTRLARGVCLIAALAVLLFMASIAYTHDPLGALASLRG